MNELQAPVKFLMWVLTIAIGFGTIGSLGPIALRMAEKAIEAQQHDQMSYGKFSRQLCQSKKTN